MREASAGLARSTASISDDVSILDTTLNLWLRIHAFAGEPGRLDDVARICLRQDGGAVDMAVNSWGAFAVSVTAALLLGEDERAALAEAGLAERVDDAVGDGATTWLAIASAVRRRDQSACTAAVQARSDSHLKQLRRMYMRRRDWHLMVDGIPMMLAEAASRRGLVTPDLWDVPAEWIATARAAAARDA